MSCITSGGCIPNPDIIPGSYVPEGAFKKYYVPFSSADPASKDI